MKRFIHLLKAMRPNQWTKNAVVLAPYFFACGDRHLSLPPAATMQILLATGLFCLVSSGVYLVNDLVDQEADRLHPTKRFRPIASGELPRWLAAGVAVLLLAHALVGAAWLARPFLITVLAYVAMQAGYTFFLKRIALVDVFIIAAGFVLRAIAGGVAIHVPVSPWLLICSFLLALFLALCKRRHEKLVLEEGADSHRASLEYYSAKLVDQLIAIVSAAVIVSYSIYTLSAETVQKFGTTHLFLTIPLVVFGIFRYLDLVYRKEAGGSPETTLLTDMVLLADIALYALVTFIIFKYS